MREDKRPLDDIVAAACQAEGSITGAAEILEISKQAVSKRLKGVRVLTEIWMRQNGNGKTAEIFEKEFRVGFEERVEKAVQREARRWDKAHQSVTSAEERQREYQSRLGAAEEKEKGLLQDAAEGGDVEGNAKEIAEARALRDTLKEVIRNNAILIGEAKAEMKKAAGDLERAARRAILAWREDVTRDVLEGLEAVLAMEKAWGRAVVDGLNGLNGAGLPVSASCLGWTDRNIIPGDEVETAVRDLRRRLNAQEETEERMKRNRRYEEEFRKSGKRVHHVTGTLVDKELGRR
jgi:hypothetical protein